MQEKLDFVLPSIELHIKKYDMKIMNKNIMNILSKKSIKNRLREKKIFLKKPSKNFKKSPKYEIKFLSFF